MNTTRLRKQYLNYLLAFVVKIVATITIDLPF